MYLERAGKALIPWYRAEHEITPPWDVLGLVLSREARFRRAFLKIAVSVDQRTATIGAHFFESCRAVPGPVLLARAVRCEDLLMKLLLKFNLILLVIFGAGGVLIATVAYRFLRQNADREVLSQAELMMASAKSVRDYTSVELVPLLTQVPEHRVHFLPETVPAFGATSTFNRLRERYPQYRYKEATLNPTNLEDRAADWEVDVVHWLRDHQDQRQYTGERQSGIGQELYLASPIRAVHSCLQCHSVPKAAPAAMLAVYGPDHGFGWKENEIVGAQIVSVPMALPIQIANRAFHRLLWFLVATLVVTTLALDAGVFWFVIRPLRQVSAMADRVSRGDTGVEPVEARGNDEVAVVTRSFNRMQKSLEKALRMLDE